MGKSFSKDECEKKFNKESNNCAYNIDDFIQKGICYGEARTNKQECLDNVKEITEIIIGVSVVAFFLLLLALLIIGYKNDWHTKIKNFFPKKS